MPSSATVTGNSFNGSNPPVAASLACRRRQVNNRLALTPWRCATLDTDAPGAVLSATIRRFSSLDQKRRRRKPVGFVALSAKSQFISIVSTIVDGHYIVPLFAHYRSPRPSVPGGPRRRLTDPALLVKLIKTEGVTFTHGVPTLLRMLLDAAAKANVDLAGLKMVIGGSGLPTALARQAIDRGVDVFAGYGMSETGPLLTVAHLKSNDLSGDPDQEVGLRTRAGLRLPAGRFAHC